MPDPVPNTYAQQPQPGAAPEAPFTITGPVSAAPGAEQYAQAQPAAPASEAPQYTFQPTPAPDANGTPTPAPTLDNRQGQYDLNFGGGQTSPDQTQPANVATGTEPTPVAAPQFPTVNSGSETAPAVNAQPNASSEMANPQEAPDLTQALSSLPSTGGLPTTPAEGLGGAAVSSQAEAMNAVMGGSSTVGDAKIPSPTETFSKMSGGIGPENQDGKKEKVNSPEQILTNAQDALGLPITNSDPNFRNIIYKGAEIAMAESLLRN